MLGILGLKALLHVALSPAHPNNVARINECRRSLQAIGGAYARS